MEDATCISDPMTSGQCAFNGAFDGHGGRADVDFVGARLVPNIRAAAGPRVSGDALQTTNQASRAQQARATAESAAFADLECARTSGAQSICNLSARSGRQRSLEHLQI